jgi:uncharacterized protein
MEEILASIRRIIAEDGEQPPAAEKPTAVQPVAPSAAGASVEEVLELTEVVEPEPAKPATAAEPVSDWAPPERHSVPVAEDHMSPSDHSADHLVSDAAAAASMAALSQLQQFGGRKEKPMSDIPLGEGQRSIEDLVREMLRPLLKEWLDSNLPSLVERVVRDEVDRLVRDLRRP